MIHFIEQIRDTLFFPQRMDGYSLFFSDRLFDAQFLVKKKQLPVNHPVAFWNVIALYLVFIIPCSIIFGIASASVEVAAASAILLLGVGLLLGSIHTTLGLMGVLTGIVLGTVSHNLLDLNSGFSRHWWLGAPILLLPLALYAQVLASSATKLHIPIARPLLAGILGLAAVYALGLTGMAWGLPLYYTLFLLSFALAAPKIEISKSSIPSLDLKADFASWLGIISSTILLILVLWEWCGLWTAGLATGWKYLIYPLTLIVGVVIYAVVLIETYFITRSAPPPGLVPVYYAERRWIAFLFYACLQLVLDPTVAFAAALAGTAVYSLSLTSLNRNQDAVPPRSFIAAVTITALVWLYFTAGVVVNTSWLNFARAFFTPPVESTMSLGVIAFLLPAYVLTIIGRSKLDIGWMSFLFLYFIGIWIINVSRFSTNQLMIAGFLAFAGLSLGYTRALAVPWLSLVISRETRFIRSQKKLQEDRLYLAANLMEIDCSYVDAQRIELAVELLKRGLENRHLNNEHSDKLLAQARQKIVSEMFDSDFSLEQLLDNDLTGAPKTVLDTLGLLRNAASPKTSRFERQKVYLEVAHTLQTRLKEGQTSVALPAYEKEVIDRMRKVLLREVAALYAERKQFEDSLSRIASSIEEIPSHEVPYEAIGSSKTERHMLETDFRKYLQMVHKLSSEIQSLDTFRQSFSPEDQDSYRVLASAKSALQLEALRLDLPAQRQAIQAYGVEIGKIEPGLAKDTWRYDEKRNEVVKAINPWFEVIAYMSQLVAALQALLDSQVRWAKRQVISICSEADSLEKLAELSKKLDDLNAFGEKYGSPLDETIKRLDDVSRDAASALASKGYDQRLGIQETLDRLNDLRGLLSTRFLNEAADIMKPLDALARSLYESIHARADDQTLSFKNPYLTGNPIKESRYALFKGRRELAEKIVHTMRSRTTPTFVLYGPRRMGKTSFLLQLHRLLPTSRFIPAYVDMQDGRAQSDAQFLYSLASALYRQIKKMLNVVEKPDLATFEGQPFIAFDEWLDSLQPQLADKSIFFTIDEFEVIGKAIAAGTLTERVLEHLRHIMQHNENIILLFAGVQTIEALGPNASSYFISAYPLEISYLSKADAEELILRPDPSAGQMPAYDEDVVKAILQLTRCQPYLIQAICNEILVLANENSLARITAPVLQESVARVLATSLYFKNLWDDSGTDGQSILHSIAMNPKTRIGPDMMAVIKDLQKRHLICPVEGGYYAIEIPLVELWIRNQHLA